LFTKEEVEDGSAGDGTRGSNSLNRETNFERLHNLILKLNRVF